MGLTCLTCGKEFEPHDARQKCCSKKCGSKRYEKTEDRRKQGKNRYHKNREAIRRTARERYQADPEYRKKIVAYMNERRKTHPERIKEINEKYRDTPERRTRAASLSRAWHAENRSYANPRRTERKQMQRVHRPWGILVQAAKYRSKKFGIVFDLTDEWAKSRWTGKCELTNLPFSIGLRGSSGKLFSPSIDKINPKLGYLQTNCRFVLHAVNIFKYTGTDEQMYEIAEALLKNRIMLLSPNKPKSSET